MAFNSDPNYWLALGKSLNQMAYAPINPNADAAAPMQAYQKGIADQNAAAKQMNAAEMTQNKTLEWLKANDPEAYQYAQAGLPVNDAFKYAVDKRQKAQQTPTAEVVKGDNNSFYTYDPKNPQGTFKALQGPVEDPKEAEKQRLEAAKLEADTNKMYRGEDPVKQYEGVKAGFEKVRASALQPSGPSDLGIIFGYMKMLDPTSVVRETEQASIENAAGVPEQVRGLWNKVRTGEKLPDNLRAEIVNAAQKIYEETASNVQERNKYYQDYSTRSGINPGYIIQPETFPKLELNGPAAEIKTSTGPVKLRKTGE